VEFKWERTGKKKSDLRNVEWKTGTGREMGRENRGFECDHGSLYACMEVSR
jgi:hypothetical protein